MNEAAILRRISGRQGCSRIPIFSRSIIFILDRLPESTLTFPIPSLANFDFYFFVFLMVGRTGTEVNSWKDAIAGVETKQRGQLYDKP